MQAGLEWFHITSLLYSPEWNNYWFPLMDGQLSVDNYVTFIRR